MARPEIIDYNGRRVWRVGPMDELLKGLDALLATKSEQRLMLIVAEAGVGKSLGARIWCDEHRDEACYISVPPSSVLRTGRLLQLLEVALEMPTGTGNLFDRLRAIVDALIARPRMIVFDEADRLRRIEYLDLIRYIHEEAPAARFAFISIPALEGVIRNRSELRTRLFMRLQLSPLTRAEVAAVLPDMDAGMVDAIKEASGGRMREVMVIAEHFRNVDPRLQTAEKVRSYARRYMSNPLGGRAA